MRRLRRREKGVRRASESLLAAPRMSHCPAVAACKVREGEGEPEANGRDPCDTGDSPQPRSGEGSAETAFECPVLAARRGVGAGSNAAAVSCPLAAAAAAALSTCCPGLVAAPAATGSGFVEFGKEVCGRLNAQIAAVLLCCPDFLERVGPALAAALSAVDGAPSLLVSCSRRDTALRFQRCTRIFGRKPLLALTDLPGDRICALDLDPAASAAACVEVAAAFVAEWRAGNAPQAPRGEEPEPGAGDRGRVSRVVQCDFRSVVYSPAFDVVVVLSAPRCPCCGDALDLAALLARQLDDAGAATLRFVTCNVDENELAATDWNEHPDEQVIPQIRMYPAADKQPRLYVGPRTARGVLAFIDKHASLPTSRFDVAAVVVECEAEQRPRKSPAPGV